MNVNTTCTSILQKLIPKKIQKPDKAVYFLTPNKREINIIFSLYPISDFLNSLQ